MPQLAAFSWFWLLQLINAEMAELDEIATPAWGALPVEQYLIVSQARPNRGGAAQGHWTKYTLTNQPRLQREWDHSSELSADEQRAELVAAYIDEDVLDPALLASTRVPTAAEIADILEPWRPQKLRRIAAALLGSCADRYYLLRTYYGGGEADDIKVRTWLDLQPALGDDYQIVPPWHEWFCVLDDPELFDFGDDWQEVYDVLPELAAPEADRRFTDADVESAREEVKDRIADGGEWNYMTDDERYQETIMKEAVVSSPPWLLVLDKDALDADEFGLILRDKKGNTVKESEIDPGALDEFMTRYGRGMFYEGYWEHGRPGNKYRIRGKIMRRLLRLAKGGEQPRGLDS